MIQLYNKIIKFNKKIKINKQINQNKITSLLEFR